MLERAKELAKKYHKGQKDLAGTNYFLHVQAVGEMGKTQEEKIVGYLHDIVEDTSMTTNGLLGLGFTPEIVRAIDAITRREDESWNAYIRRVGENPLATKVKINDLTHNSDLSRIASPSEKDFDRVRTYQQAITKLRKKMEQRGDEEK